ncbi:hypothetical protein Apa02nite_056690 [Actinoplanes palleronii]|uniref:Uncharacterized protein n=1 Tax=Actinoplanes palleronii TaxID=113570 RepID=A0ABQ4BFW0_9ACTN|nr:hypothetical protein Apa02nite_056690 [Actinoplanes palleronii]
MASMREVEVTRPIRWAGTIACRREGASTMVAPMPAPRTASAREKAGFALVAEGELEPDKPIDDRLHRVLRRDRPA